MSKKQSTPGGVIIPRHGEVAGEVRLLDGDIVDERGRKITVYPSQIVDLINEVNRYRAARPANAKDAARYRWLRHNWASVGESYAFWPSGLADWQLDEQVDKEIGK